MPGGQAPLRLESPLLEEDVRDLYENAPCGYLSMTPDGMLRNVNGTFLRWTGHAREALLGGTRFLDLLTPGGRIFYETHLSPLLRMQGFVREIALDLLCADGHRLPVLVNASLRPDESGAPAIVRVTIFDATERRLYERELLHARSRAEESSRAKAALLAMISHDIRAPLSAILTAVALLDRTELTASQRRFVRVLKSSSTQALALVDSTLEHSHLESGRAVLREDPFDFGKLAREVVASARLIADQKPSLEVRLDVDERIPDTLYGDAGKIGQVLTNLVTNAVKFTEEGFVSLVVAARDVSDTAVVLEVLVSDTGIGIPADRIPFIFDEFTQASGDIARKYGGAGLGLAISRKLLQLYHSELRVSSTLGQGTTFTFLLQLPRAAAGEAAGQAERS